MALVHQILIGSYKCKRNVFVYLRASTTISNSKYPIYDVRGVKTKFTHTHHRLGFLGINHGTTKPEMPTISQKIEMTGSATYSEVPMFLH